MEIIKEHIRKKLNCYSKEELIEMMTNLYCSHLSVNIFGGMCAKDVTPSCETAIRDDLEQIINATSRQVSIKEEFK